ncbi:MAG: DUF2974 domain-containing protein [Eubacterium sp.]|nr:DUF2974 domain-containing protein [Eubacterium sp.]
MANVQTYVEQYGSISFKNKPFTDSDNVAMCCSFYMPLDLVVSSSLDDEPVPFDEACNKLFALRGNEHKPVGLVLVKEISVLLMTMAKKRRFKEMKVVGCREFFQTSPAVQFDAGTFLLPNGDIVVIFRGTDDTLTGWKEDVDMLAEDGIPSHKLATDYLKEVCDKFDGDIIVCGHSKGGYVANYAAIYSDKEVRDRIKRVYNNDGPGFANYDYLESDAFKEILPKYVHLIPEGSFIGMMLSHDDKYRIIKSNRKTGALQHDLLSWQFRDEHLIECDELGTQSKVSDLVFQDIVSNISDEDSKILGDAVGTVFEGIGQKGLLDVKSNPRESLKGLVAAWKSIDADTKKTLRKIMGDAAKSVAKATKTVAKGDYKPVGERLEEANED